MTTPRIDEFIPNHIRSGFPPSGGLYFLAAMAALCGGYLLAIGLGHLGEDSKVHAPRWIFTWYGAYFLMVALMLAGPALWRTRPLPGGPAWKHDRRWHSRGIRDTTDRKLAAQLFSIVMVIGFLVPCVEFWPEMSRAMLSGWTMPIWIFGFGLFALIMLLVILNWFWRLGGRLRDGRAWLGFSSFPYTLGRKLEARFEGPASLAGKQARIRLRCVEDRVIETRHGSKRTMKMAAYAIYRAEEEKQLDGRGGIELSFELPADLPPTQLRKAPVVYWELVVTVSQSGPDFEAIFLLPVYA